MKTTLITPPNKITHLEICHEDFYQISYYGYDNRKKTHCIITYPKIKTSWNFTIEYK